LVVLGVLPDGLAGLCGYALRRQGYVIHEAATWSDAKRKWVFLPRRVSALPYDEELDEKMGSNKVVIASENFDQVRSHWWTFTDAHPAYSAC
jgi:hypothetical protein